MFEPQQAEDYFSSLASPSRRLMQDINEVQNDCIDVSESQDWETLSEKSKERLLDERLIDNLNGCSKPRPQKYHTLGHNSRRRSRDNKMQSLNGKTTVRLSTFGVEQVFPRLKIDTGQKEVTVEETPNGFRADNPTDNYTYTYLDEHSAPFAWTTRSQQELRFEAGTPDQNPTEKEVSEQGLDTLRTISPKNATLLIRQSRGNPCYAKPVQTPQVPAKSPNSESSSMAVEKKAIHPPVSPHRINNFVYESSPNRLIFDFGVTSGNLSNSAGISLQNHTDEKMSLNGSDISGASTGHNSSSDCSSARSSAGLLAKMKERTRASIKRSISSVNNKNRPKKDNSIGNNENKTHLSKYIPHSKDFINYKYSPTNSSLTLSTLSITNNSMTSLQSNQTLTSSAHQYYQPINSSQTQSRQNSLEPSTGSGDRITPTSNNSSSSEPIYGTCRRHITKPNHAPPPPPTQLTKPIRAPPPPPIEKDSVIHENIPFITQPCNDNGELSPASPDKEYSTETKVQTIDSSVERNLPKTSITSESRALDKLASTDANRLKTAHLENYSKLAVHSQPTIIAKNEDLEKIVDKEESNKESTQLEKTEKVMEAEMPLEDFKIDLHIDLEIPKTGFDFLDNW